MLSGPTLLYPNLKRLKPLNVLNVLKYPMTNELLTFQKFKDPDIARDIAEKLKQAGIFEK